MAGMVGGGWDYNRTGIQAGASGTTGSGRTPSRTTGLSGPVPPPSMPMGPTGGSSVSPYASQAAPSQPPMYDFGNLSYMPPPPPQFATLGPVGDSAPAPQAAGAGSGAMSGLSTVINNAAPEPIAPGWADDQPLQQTAGALGTGQAGPAMMALANLVGRRGLY